ncbi:M48 family metallopeptidase [Albibacterium indicum]|uniref:M48 family metallopeptidase n=1 Tax=Albibacterium indicum TaxID=2292082 RepID=UPI000E4C0910|nr:M48 family metallopeptidase [Pedobacter indicus]
MKNIQRIIGSFLLIGLISACSTVPFTGRKQLSLIDDSGLREQASLAYRDFLNSPETTVIKGTSDANEVQRVGQRISRAITTYFNENGMGDQYNFDWQFALVKDKNINAWCMPGGKVAIFTGILPVTKNEAGLAAVMGHEIAHAIAKHSAERASQMVLAQGGGAVVGVASSGQSQATQAVVNQLYGIGGQLALLNYSRNQESEADRMGLIFMAMAGYNPNEAAEFWTRMMDAKEGAGAPPEFLSSHPSDARRIKNIQKLIPEAMEYYKAR